MILTFTKDGVAKFLWREIMTLDKAKQEARRKAFDSLARYKFMMFGYHAALWVTLNNLDTNKERNPFSALVKLAGETKD